MDSRARVTAGPTTAGTLRVRFDAASRSTSGIVTGCSFLPVTMSRPTYWEASGSGSTRCSTTPVVRNNRSGSQDGLDAGLSRLTLRWISWIQGAG